MGCNCGKNRLRRQPAPVSEDTPNPNDENQAVDEDAWWQANPPLPPTAAIPMPS
jgi:hypothetical protein